MQQQIELSKECEKHNILLMSYSSLGSGHLLDNDTVKTIAERYNVSTSVVLLRWGLQRGTVVIPKSSSEEHLIDNTRSFDITLTEEDMTTLNNLEENKHFCWEASHVI
eukprot:TRINITY_DN6799_c0_g1_i1.p1 TRINITY_DN6799_c0_g1~~TRINITY_DN6799_c0_g1_i1.p1  ORF type:complete len:108 (+),score=16.55 TRINITY_DN6799_c0_g1_i1:618-941(+)